MQSDGASCRVVPVGGVYAFDNFQTTAEDLSATSYTYDAANQLTAMNVDGTTTNFTYDDWGRMAGKTQGAYAAAYTYRFGDKLKAVTSNFPGETASVAYNYDGLGRRRLEQLDNTTATWFRWSGWEECGEYAGTVGSWTIGALQTGYVPGLATFAGSNPAAAEWRYHLTDHLGSVRQLSSQNKAALARYDYAPYGELMRNAGLPLTVGYTGHLWDNAIGQYYAPFRYYNPQTARWNMRDPLGFVDGPNVYAYVAGNPVNYFDILGLTLFPDDNVIGGFCNGTIDGALQLLDIANPFGEIFRNYNLYDSNSPGMHAGRIGAYVALISVDLLLTRTAVKKGIDGIKHVRAGKEISIGKNFRLAPFGNKRGYSRPHYHRRKFLPNTGKTRPGQGIGRHRPWEKKNCDTSWRDRF